MHNIRFHLIALSIITLVIVGSFYATGKLGKPAPQAPAPGEEPVGDRFVTVWEASWGLNCNDAPEYNSTTPIPGSKEPVKQNNVLKRISDYCNGKRVCEFTANTATLGEVAPGRSCRPQIDVRYRCFEFDRQWQVVVASGDKAKLDCSEQ